MNFMQNVLSGMLKRNQIEIIQLDFAITYVAPRVKQYSCPVSYTTTEI